MAYASSSLGKRRGRQPRRGATKRTSKRGAKSRYDAATIQNRLAVEQALGVTRKKK